MSLLNTLREKIRTDHPLLLFYHRLVAMAAAHWYRFPANRMKVVAVTGTKGKSTVAHLLASILREAGYRVGVASTIHFQIGERVWPNETKQTTQGRFRLQSLLREMADARCDFALVETTSHALVQSRLWGISVDTAVLTNVQRDHLEYHGGFEEYRRAKGLLFSSLSKGKRKQGVSKTAVLPKADPSFSYFAAFPADRAVTYGPGGAVHAVEEKYRADGSSFVIKTPNGEVPINLKIPGAFNVENALAAAGAALALGIGLAAIKKGLEAEQGIPGRMESIRAGQHFEVIVDYAHTPVSLEKVLAHFRPLTKKKLIVVFGATGGGRDKSKRPEMGAVADKLADLIVVTDDDPYTEDRRRIIEDVCGGIRRKEGDGLKKIMGRREAIFFALSSAGAGDTVIIAGKGCEPIQIVGTEKIPWDDRKVVRDILKDLPR